MNLDRYSEVCESLSLMQVTGFVQEIVGPLIKVSLPECRLGSLVDIENQMEQGGRIEGEVVGFSGSYAFIMPYDHHVGIRRGARVSLHDLLVHVPVSQNMLGGVYDSMGRALKAGRSGGQSQETRLLYPPVSNPLEREPLRHGLVTGIRSIDGLLTLAMGQRVAVLAGSGVGKSTLMSQIARGSKADINVIALIGERGREVREFIENDLGEEGLKRSVVIVETSDASAIRRMRGAYYATTIAEYFASQGAQVLLFMDSVTRFAMAAREIGLSLGEPPAMKGYPPSVFANMPRLFERAGAFAHGGSITGIYTVLIEGDDIHDPIGDTVRSIVDGHIVLSRALANQGHYPAVDVLQSNSRVMKSVVPEEWLETALRFRSLLALYKEYEDMIQLGVYKQGQNKTLDKVIQHWPQIQKFLRQSTKETSDPESCYWGMRDIVDRCS